MVKHILWLLKRLFGQVLVQPHSSRKKAVFLLSYETALNYVDAHRFQGQHITKLLYNLI